MRWRRQRKLLIYTLQNDPTLINQSTTICFNRQLNSTLPVSEIRREYRALMFVRVSSLYTRTKPYCS